MNRSDFFDDIDALRAAGDEAALKRLEAMQQQLFRECAASSEPFAASIALTEEGAARLESHEEGDAVREAANALDRAWRWVKFSLRDRKPDDLIIVSEGDSWFQYPWFLHDIIDNVSEHHPVLSLGGGGHLLSDMAASGEAVRAVNEIQPDILMLSGGGNDLLGQVNGRGRLFDLLLDYTDQTEPQELLNWPVLEPFLDEIERLYTRLIQHALNERGDLQVLMHTYDYVWPREGGAWLGGPLRERGAPEASWRGLVETLIDAFSERLHKIRSKIGPQAHVVNCRRTVGASYNSWADEIHPHNAGFRRASKPFLEKIAEIRAGQAYRSPETIAYGEPASPAHDKAHEPCGFSAIRALQPIPRGLEPNECHERDHDLAPPASPQSGRVRMQAIHPDALNKLDIWRQSLTCADFDAYKALLRLGRALDEPDDPERVASRSAYRARRFQLRDRNAQRIIGASDLLEASYLERGAAATRAVCIIHANGEYGPRGYGTGFLVGGGLMITAAHVLSEKEKDRSLINFGFEQAADGAFARLEAFNTDPSVFLTNEELDITIIGVAPRSRNGALLSDFGHIPMFPLSGKALKTEAVSIIQHANAQPKQVALRNNHVIGRDGDHIYYTTDTDAGSSGAPVLSDDWYAVAVHHRTVPNVNVADDWPANRGVKVSAVFDWLARVAASGAYGRSGMAQRIRAAIGADPVAAPGFPSPGAQAPVAAPLSLASPPPRFTATSYTERPGIAMGSGGPGLERFPDEKDDRVRLGDSDSRHAAVLRLRTTLTQGTTFAIGSDLLLTVEHNLTGGNLFIDRYNDRGERYDLQNALTVTAVDPLRPSQGGGGEFMGLRLQAQGRLYSVLHPVALSRAALIGQAVEVLGYPLDWRQGNSGEDAVRHQGFIREADDGLLYYDVDTSSGQSGGPVVLAGTSNVVGVHVGPFIPVNRPQLRDLNFGVHINDQLMKEISTW